MSERAMGKAKETYGAIIGDEAKKAEGRAQQRKAQAEEETKQREKTRRAENKQAEQERDRQRRKDSGGLGGLTGL